MSEQNEIDRGELVLYNTEDGAARFFLRAEGGSLWMTQAELAQLFQTTPQNITLHIKAIYGESELIESATCKPYLQVRSEGARQVQRQLKLYSLDLILAVGYRVRSERGTQFRQWATTHLKEYLIKGFVMDDARLKDPESWDYFDELLERIREIRASEKRYYQKIRDLFTLSVDYDKSTNAVGVFFAEVQNKMLFAATQLTAAEIIVKRADPTRPNMALQSWKANRVRKADVIVAKNYLNEIEVQELDRIAIMFLDYAEDRVRMRKSLTMAEWRKYTDSFLLFNERPLLKGNGKISHEDMEKVAYARYEEFDIKRRKADAIQADLADILELENMEQILADATSKKRAKKEK